MSGSQIPNSFGSGPLKDIYGTSKYEIWKFPEYIEPTAPDNGNYLTFYINIPNESYWASSPQPGVAPSQPVMNQGNGAIVARRFGLRNPAGVVGKRENFIYSKENLVLESHTTRTTTAISLFVPNTMVWSQDAIYDTVSLSQLLGGIGNIESALSSLAGGNIAASLIAGIAAKFGGGGALATGGLAAAGLALNPQNFLLFRQIDFRRFQFDFLLTPSNQKETETINQIIYLFRFHASPEVLTGSSGRFFVPPSEFDIDVVHNGNVNRNIPKINTCVMTSINVDYSAGGQWSSYYDGAAQQVRLTLNFMEKEIITKDLVQAGW